MKKGRTPPVYLEIKAESPRWLAFPAGVCAGSLAGWALALGEILWRSVYPGGLGVGELWPAVLLVAGTYATLGAGAGLAGGLLALLLSRRPDPALPARAALFTLGWGIVALLACQLNERTGAGGRSPPMLLAYFGVWLLVFLVLWLGGNRAAPAFTPLWRARRLRFFLAPLVAIPAARAVPRLLLQEPLESVNGFWRGGALMAGLLSAGVILFALSLLPPSGESRARGSRRWALAYFLLAIGASVVVGLDPVRGPVRDARPNVLLIVIDTLRPDRLSAYGYPRPTSPAIDSLAAEGVLFTDVVTPASFTMPAMASLLTGRLPYEHGVRLHPARLPSREITLAEVLSNAGYATGAVVSNGLLNRRWGFDQGFGFLDVCRESSFGPLGDLTLLRVLRDLGRGDDTAGITARRAVRWLRRHCHRPFFLWVHFFDPHFVYAPPSPHAERLAPLPAAEYWELAASWQRGEITRGELAVGLELPESVLTQGSLLYDGEVAYSDRGVGEILSALAESGAGENTLIVIVSDHGEALGEHGVNFAHTYTTHEPIMRVPLVMAGLPSLPRGRSIGAQVELTDLFPTMLELVGVPVPDAARGRSMSGLLEKGVWEGGPRAAYGENAPLLPGHPSFELISCFDQMYLPGMEGKWRMVRLPPWKLIHVPGRPEGEDLLFNLAEDPAEEVDLSREAPAVLADLKERLAVFLAEEEARAPADILPVGPETEAKLRSLGYAH